MRLVIGSIVAKAVVFCGLATARVRSAVSLLRARAMRLRSRARSAGRGWPSAENS